MSKEEVITAIRTSAEELGRVPTVADLKELRKISLRTVRRFFGRYAEALREAGFDPHGQGYKLDLATLFADWAAVARRAGKIPSLLTYSKQSRYSVGPLLTRFGGWTEVPRGLLLFAREKGLEQEWGDVLEMIEAHENVNRCAARISSTPNGKCRKAGPVYGAPLTWWTLMHAPINEMGVVYLCGVLSGQLGLVVTRIQQGFPDCEVMREVESGRWQRRLAEFEYESRNFLIHGHDPEECDMIICWEHNWPECPEWIEVVELRKVLSNQQSAFGQAMIAAGLRR